MTIRLTIEGPPRTKKNSSMLVFPGHGYSTWLQQVANWVRAGDRLDEQMSSTPDGERRDRLAVEKQGWLQARPKPPYARIMPSKAHQEWFDHAMTAAPTLRAAAREQGADLPITEPVNVRALIWRERLSGDALGFYQAIGDFLQAAQTNTKTRKQTRRGAGIIEDDVQIRSWNGSRLLKDARRPRIDLEVEILDSGQDCLDLQPAEHLSFASRPQSSALERFR